MKKKKILGIAVCAILVLGAIGGLGSNNKTTSKTGTPTKQEQQQKESPEMKAYKKFIDLKMGSDYNAVKDAFGVEGKLQHENDVAGIKTQVYEFKTGSTYASMTFQNGELVGKAMDSLKFYKQNGEKITMKGFNKVQTGMNYDQVKEIFKRDGILKSESSIGGMSSRLFSWMNSDGSNAIITFGNDGVSSKTQMNLK